LIAAVALLSLLAFLGFFLTTVYISHGRVMSLSEGVQVVSGLVAFNFLFLSIRAKRRNRESGS
jgi:presenilin-like A22 family membrane protease